MILGENTTTLTSLSVLEAKIECELMERNTTDHEVVYKTVLTITLLIIFYEAVDLPPLPLPIYLVHTNLSVWKYFAIIFLRRKNLRQY